LELVVSQCRPVPFCGSLRHRLVAALFIEGLFNNGLAQGRLEPSHSGLDVVCWLRNDNLWERGLDCSIGDEEEQQRSEYDRTHSDNHDDVGCVIAIRHNDLLSAQEHPGSPSACHARSQASDLRLALAMKESQARTGMTRREHERHSDAIQLFA